jgi:polysaccharide export outer membrane protein
VFLFRFTRRDALQNAGVDVSKFVAPEVPTVFAVDLSDAEGYLLANQFYMKHKDIVFVSDSTSVDLLKFLTVVNAVTTTTRGVIGTVTDIKAMR